MPGAAGGAGHHGQLHACTQDAAQSRGAPHTCARLTALRTDRWMRRYSIPKISLCCSGRSSGRACALARERLSYNSPFWPSCGKEGGTGLRIPNPPKYPHPSLLWGQHCPAESAPPGCTPYPEGAGPPPALQLFPANREPCASF